MKKTKAIGRKCTRNCTGQKLPIFGKKLLEYEQSMCKIKEFKYLFLRICKKNEAYQ